MPPDPAAARRAPITPVALEDAIAAAVEAIAASRGATAAVDAALAAFHEKLEGGFVSLFLREHGLLWLAGMRGYAMVPDGLSLHEGIVGRAARSAEPQLALDVTEDPEFIPSVTGIVSELAVPIPGSDGVAAVLNVETTAGLPAEAALLVEPLRAALVAPVE